MKKKKEVNLRDVIAKVRKKEKDAFRSDLRTKTRQISKGSGLKVDTTSSKKRELPDTTSTKKMPKVDTTSTKKMTKVDTTSSKKRELPDTTYVREEKKSEKSKATRKTDSYSKEKGYYQSEALKKKLKKIKGK